MFGDFQSYSFHLNLMQWWQNFGEFVEIGKQLKCITYSDLLPISSRLHTGNINIILIWFPYPLWGYKIIICNQWWDPLCSWEGKEQPKRVNFHHFIINKINNFASARILIPLCLTKITLLYWQQEWNAMFNTATFHLKRNEVPWQLLCDLLVQQNSHNHHKHSKDLKKNNNSNFDGSKIQRLST